MLKKGIVVTGLFLIAGAAPAFAQARVEASGFVGWSISDGVTGDPVFAGDGNIYDEIKPKNAVIYGFTVGVLVSDGAELGFRWAQQPSTLVVKGTSSREAGDMSINSYHGYFAYNFGDRRAPLRPFVLIGFGASQYGEVDIRELGRTIGGESRFSTTWAAGVKYFAGPRVGVRAAFEWTPTYITTNSVGWWCDPYWGCYLVGNAQYSNQVQFNGGVTVRF